MFEFILNHAELVLIPRTGDHKVNFYDFKLIDVNNNRIVKPKPDRSFLTADPEP